MPEINVGDVLAVRTSGIAGAAIRFGAALRHLPSSVNHIVVAHHQDDHGVWWGIEGRPGGVGWADLRPYLSSPATITNAEQPRTDEQRHKIADLCAELLGTKYDWSAIVADAADDLGFEDRFAENWNGLGAPTHVVCSSLAAWVYGFLHLPHPGRGRYVQPADWALFMERKVWSWLTPTHPCGRGHPPR